MDDRSGRGRTGAGSPGRPQVRRRSRTWDLVAGALATLAIVVYAVNTRPVVDHVAYLGLLVGAGLSAVLAAERVPREHRLAPRLIAVGLCLNAVGDVVWQVLDSLGSSTDVSLADPPWVAGYVCLCVAMWVVLARTRTREEMDAAFVIDAATVVAVSVVVFWNLSIGAIVADHTVTSWVRLAWAAYPVVDAVLLALVARVLLSRRARTMVDPGFAVGVGLWLAADIIYLQAPTGRGEVLSDLAWMLAPVLMARAVWRWQPAHEVVGMRRTPGRRLAALSIAVVPLFVPTALEVAGDLRGEPDRPVQLAVGSIVLVALAFVRTARLIRSEERVLHELESARDEALAASRAKSMFVATMSHEIRTPLTTVLVCGEMLDATSLTAEQHDLLRRMRRSGGLLHALVEDVLDFSRIESGHVEVAAVPYDLHALVEGLDDTYAARAAAAGLQLDCRVEDVPRRVTGDPARLLQVVGNLLDNALKFTERGTVRLHVRTAAACPDAFDEDGDRVLEVVVADTGIGIPEDRIDAVFDAFEQADGSTTRRFGGSGLGLSICRQLVTLMGGSISVRSTPGVGSEFAVRLPLGQADPSAGEPADRPLAGVGAAGTIIPTADVARVGHR